MAINPRTKGATGEREAARLLTLWAGEVGVQLELERNLEQVRSGGADLNGIDGMEVEVKRVENLSIPKAWQQVCAAAERSGKHPLLMHRKNRQAWQFRTNVDAAIHIGGRWELVPLVADMDSTQAKNWFKSYIKLTYGVM